jgi:hypothetical protein
VLLRDGSTDDLTGRFRAGNLPDRTARPRRVSLPIRTSRGGRDRSRHTSMVRRSASHPPGVLANYLSSRME